MNQQEVLARTIWGEARGEGFLGMKAIACVALNRAAKPSWWGTTIEGVCLKPWQFSCWNKNDPNLAKLQAVTEENPIFSQCMQFAKDAINGLMDDVTNGATHYFDKRIPIPPKWAENLEPCAIIGHHMFYKNID